MIRNTAAWESNLVEGPFILRGDHFRFAVSLDGRNWTEVGEPATGDYLPLWDRAVRVALTAGGASGGAAKFEWFRIAPKKAMRDAR